MSRLSILVVLFALAAAIACSTSSTGSTPGPRIYTEPFGQLWDAAHAALIREGLEIVGEDHQRGVVVATYDAGPGFGKTEVGFIIQRPRRTQPRDAWEVSVEATLPPGAEGGQGWESIMRDLERELMQGFNAALGARRYSVESDSRFAATPTPIFR